MAKLPKRIKVGPHTYTVEQDDRARADSGNPLYGATYHATLRIYIAQDLSVSQEQDTLLHELLHTIWDQTGLSHEVGAEEEEKMVRRICPVLLHLLQTNPRLVEYLVQ